MARIRRSSPSRLNRDASRLVALATALDESGSRVEDRYWEAELGRLLAKLLRASNDATLEAALDHLSHHHAGGYEVLIEQAETASESLVLEKDGQRHDVLLLVAPVVAWTRYSIANGPIPQAAQDTLRAQLHGHVLAEGAQLALLPTLVSLDQMPRTFSDTWQWLHRLGSQALGLEAPRPALQPGPGEDVPPMLADTRYVVAGVVVPEGAPLFRWQEANGGSRADALVQWIAQAQPTLAGLLPGCGVECLLPDAYYVSNRDADRRVRPLALKAAVAWLEGAAGLAPDQLRAVIGGCGETRVDEYRISFTPRNRNDVIYGCVWPVYGREEEPLPEDAEPTGPDAIEEIAALLKEQGVADIRRLPGILPPDYCEDCGTPYFPNPLGEMTHPELPEDANTAPAHFH
ncbi:FIG00432723: hypothetical protein [plant metagenome]|uniref:DUF2863 domain-containing protein n=1 Tax=plant metagenome TaxID=1297885 RepID=A0A484SQA7_9ZZZZ